MEIVKRRAEILSVVEHWKRPTTLYFKKVSLGRSLYVFSHTISSGGSDSHLAWVISLSFFSLSLDLFLSFCLSLSLYRFLSLYHSIVFFLSPLYLSLYHSIVFFFSLTLSFYVTLYLSFFLSHSIFLLSLTLSLPLYLFLSHCIVLSLSFFLCLSLILSLYIFSLLKRRNGERCQKCSYWYETRTGQFWLKFNLLT